MRRRWRGGSRRDSGTRAALWTARRERRVFSRLVVPAKKLTDGSGGCRRAAPAAGAISRTISPQFVTVHLSSLSRCSLGPVSPLPSPSSRGTEFQISPLSLSTCRLYLMTRQVCSASLSLSLSFYPGNLSFSPPSPREGEREREATRHVEAAEIFGRVIPSVPLSRSSVYLSVANRPSVKCSFSLFLSPSELRSRLFTAALYALLLFVRVSALP